MSLANTKNGIAIPIAYLKLFLFYCFMAFNRDANSVMFVVYESENTIFVLIDFYTKQNAFVHNCATCFCTLFGFR